MFSYCPPDNAVAVVDLRNIPTQSVGNHSDGVGSGFFCTDYNIDLDSDYKLIGNGNHITEALPEFGASSAWQSMFGITPVGTYLVDWLAYTLTDGSDPDGLTGPKPLMPCVYPTGEVVIELAGHSVVYRRRIELRVGNSTFVKKVRERVRKDLQLIADTGDDFYWRQCLASLKEKYWQRWDDPDEDYLLTNRLKNKKKGKNGKCRAEPHSTTYTESWPSNGAITSGQNNGWSFWLGTDMTVSSNQLTDSAVFTGWKYARMTSATSSSDTYAQAKFISRNGTLSSYAVIVRKDSSSTDTNYFGQWYQNDIYSQKVISGTPTTLGTSAQTPSANDILKNEANGSAIKVYKNGSSVISSTDTAISSNTYGGVGHYSNSHKVISDDWEYGDLTSAVNRKRSLLLLM